MKKILLYILSIVSLCGVIFFSIYYLTLEDKEEKVQEKPKGNLGVMGVMILISFLNTLNHG